ncbi:spore cortex-lytic enzyme [Hydrogenibacillus schlegelii]|uniref:spore cortex-lytic enzyme n=1 Tax=Hydrogenibacillus schlegelii TaxID=1484 RepID=UPI0007973FC3|nr:hypothetical protein TR75_08730 [Hydrogenibacillus schlegelii]
MHRRSGREKGRRSALIVLTALVAATFALAGAQPAENGGWGASRAAAFGKGTLRVGARGGDVYELQGRLKYLGYYTGPVDGVFGWRTYWAVRNFQYRFGLRVDGAVGPATKAKLYAATRGWRPTAPATPARKAGFAGPVLRVGARGGAVFDVQGRLKFLGYYKGPVDGVFGWRTYWAVRNFQYRFGLRVDGAVGPATKAKLYAATKGYRPTATAAPKPAPRTTGATTTPTGAVVGARGRFTAQEVRLMANAVYGEARGEPYVGQVAVAAVILNRLHHPAFPNTIAGIIFQPGAFTAVADGQIWLTPNVTARRAVIDAINGWDPSGGAIYYFNPATATSAWIWSRPQIKRIGNHIFAR